MLVFLRIDSAVSAARTHLEAAGAWGTEAEGFVTAHIVVMSVSEYEDRIERMVVRRAERARDVELTNFVKKRVHQFFRSPDFAKVSEVLKSFSEATHTNFRISVSEQDISAWGNLMTARHALVHKRGAFQLTFREVESSLMACSRIMDATASALQLDAADLAVVMA
jgi:hypothetical protein